MDPLRFDRLAVAFGSLRSRRETARLLAAGAAAALGLRQVLPASARPAGRCHPDQPDGASCGACRICQKGTCVTVADGTECSSGKGDCAVCLDGTCRGFQVGDPCGKASCFVCRESGQC